MDRRIVMVTTILFYSSLGRNQGHENSLTKPENGWPHSLDEP